MNNDLVIVIPIYKSSVSLLEQFSLDYLLGKAPERKMVFLAPEGLDTTYYKSRYSAIAYEFFDPKYFRSVGSYNQLLLESAFYERFLAFSYLLIYQTDALLFKNDLDDWMERGYDYIGAPWPNGVPFTLQEDYGTYTAGTQLHAFVGNGGFSLRNVRKCMEILHEAGNFRDMWRRINYPEDCFFAFASILTGTLKIPDADTASCFALELAPEHYYERSKVVPTGCHDWVRQNFPFWQKMMGIAQ